MGQLRITKEGSTMQNKRFFAFGCSYTGYRWPTWADIIGVNFELYRNYGRGGASNLYILQKFLQANDLYKFNKNDVIFVMFTGFGRFTYYQNNDIHTHGEIRSWYESTKDPSVGKFLDSGIWTDDLGATNSYIAAKTIKNLLENIGCKYRLHLSIDNSHYIKHPSRFFQMDIALELAEEFYNTLDEKLSFEEWVKINYTEDDSYKFTDNNTENRVFDNHPTIEQAANYVKQYFPEYYTSVSKEFVDDEIKQIDFTDYDGQGGRYDTRKYIKWGRDKVQQ